MIAESYLNYVFCLTLSRSRRRGKHVAGRWLRAILDCAKNGAPRRRSDKTPQLEPKEKCKYALHCADSRPQLSLLIQSGRAGS